MASCSYPATCKATGDDFFTGNYAPVHQELCTSDVAISGQVPEALLGGMYLRNGPNPPFKPEGGYHWCVTGWLAMGSIHEACNQPGTATTACNYRRQC